MNMNIEIKKLTPALLDDWLAFFDSTAFTDNESWAGCYCMCYHWTRELNAKKSWDCGKKDAPVNRKCAVSLIRSGKMQGYLAYADGVPAGWCNSTDISAYENVNFTLPYDPSDGKAKAVVCFCIAPGMRGLGIASLLLEKVCSDAADEGYDCVKAYPFCENQYGAYHGPAVMYEKAGFEPCGSVSECLIYKKILK